MDCIAFIRDNDNMYNYHRKNGLFYAMVIDYYTSTYIAFIYNRPSWKNLFF